MVGRSLALKDFLQMKDINLKALLFVALGVSAALLMMGAAATTTRYKGVLVSSSSTITNLTSTTITNSSDMKVGGTLVVDGVTASGTIETTDVFYGNGNGLTNLGFSAIDALGTAARSNAVAFLKKQTADTNTAGDLTLEAASTFLQMEATGNTTGFRMYDLFNGGSEFQMRRRANGGASVSAIIYVLTNDVFTFGVPVGVSSNAVAAWPVAPRSPGDAMFVNSNGVIHLLTSGLGSTWTATNRIAP